MIIMKNIHILIYIGVLALLLILLGIYSSSEQQIKDYGPMIKNKQLEIVMNSRLSQKDMQKELFNKERIIKQLSERLKDSQQKIGQLNCNQNAKSDSGGWCQRISGASSKEHVTDENMVKYLSNFLKGKEVASFGDGPGMYKKKISELNQVKLYDAYDGAPFTEETTDNRCKFLDLSVPIYHLPKYDWIVTMEVAEHIPKSYESIFLDNVVRHAKEGIILSWAKPGQAGFSHINNQPFDYVVKQMESRNFKWNMELSEKIKKAAKVPWLKDNLNVFERFGPK